MKKKTIKQKNYLRVTIVLIALLVIFSLIYAINVNSDNSFHENFKLTLNEINNLNLLIDDLDLNDPTKFTLENGLTCYITNEDYIDKIKDLYIFPFLVDSNYKIVYSGEKKQEKLYTCIKENCKINKLSQYEILSEEKNIKVIRINNNKYFINKINGKWKFQTPVEFCE